jgi:molecular chaperone GrpE
MKQTVSSGVKVMYENRLDPNSEQDNDLAEQLQGARQEAAENYDKYLRALAESENMRKRLERLCEDRMWQEKKRLLTHFLELADQLEEAIKYADADDPVIAGIRMTYQRMQSILSQEGVQPFPSVGEPFDPNIHEAVELAADHTRDQNEVTCEYRKGYVVDGKLLRPARVEVNRTG